jgi:hypothetical protein
MRSIMVVASLALITAGCSPDQLVGFGRSAQGAPLLVDCGAWFRGIEVADAQTGRAIWAAAANDSTGRGVDEVVVGTAPAGDWTERVALDPGSGPATWRFALTFRDFPAKTIDIADHDLVVGSVYLPDRDQQVSRKAFFDDVCGYAPMLPPAVSITLVVVAFLAIASGLGAWRARRRRLVRGA